MNTFSPNAITTAGRFDLVCSADADKKTFIREQFVKAPFHLSKPYWDGNVLVVQSVNSTAGVFAGDRLVSNVTVERGANVLFTTPSAHRIYSMPEGRAEMVQHFHVAQNAWLEVLPELFVPQKDCRYRHETNIQVEHGGNLFFSEYLAPGRVAHDEKFHFTEVDWTLNIFTGDDLVVHEKFLLKPDDESLWSLKKVFPVSYYGACYIVTDRDLELSEPVTSADALIGVTRLAENVWAAKILAASSEALRQAVMQIRVHVSRTFPQLQSTARKL